jgi:hypothetical protein
MFCSTECRDEFYKHVDLSSKETFNKIEFLLKKIEVAFGGQENLNKYLKKNLSCTIFDFDFSDSSHPDYWLNIYKCFLSAKPSETDDDVWQDYDATTRKLLNHISGNFTNNLNGTLRQQHKGNYFNKSTKQCGEPNESASTFYFTTFRALLNNSCVPNITSFFIENTTIFYVIQPIKANEQLFVAYA